MKVNIDLIKLISRIAFAFFVSVIMFLGCISLGLRWESKQPIGDFTVYLNQSLNQERIDCYSISGLLSQNWSGEFVINEKGVEYIIPVANITTLTNINHTQPSNLMRLFFSMIFSFLISIATALGAYKLSLDFPFIGILRKNIRKPVVQKKI